MPLTEQSLASWPGLASHGQLTWATSIPGTFFAKSDSRAQAAASRSRLGGHSENPTFGAFVFGLMIGLPLASTSTALALMCMSRHFRVLRASSMNCSAYCGASNMGDS